MYFDHLNERKYPFLKFLHQNRLVINDSAYSEMAEYQSGMKAAKQILEYFIDKDLPVYYVTKALHEKLQHTESFIEKKSVLATAPESRGLLLLPQALTPVTVSEDAEWRPQDLKMDCILYTIVKWSTMDMLKYGKSTVYDRNDYGSEEDYLWDKGQYENCRWLHFLPIQLDKFFHIHSDSIMAVDDEYGTSYNEFGRDINGNVIDYLWSFILHYHYGTLSKQPMLENKYVVTSDNANIIEIVNSTV